MVADTGRIPLPPRFRLRSVVRGSLARSADSTGLSFPLASAREGRRPFVWSLYDADELGGTLSPTPAAQPRSLIEATNVQTQVRNLLGVLFCGAIAAPIAPRERPPAAMFGAKVGYLTR